MGRAVDMHLRNSFDGELFILDYFCTNYESTVCLSLPEDERMKRVIEVVLNSEIWVDHSGEVDLPPDFVCNSQGFMLEAMRVDDHERPGRKKGSHSESIGRARERFNTKLRR